MNALLKIWDSLIFPLTYEFVPYRWNLGKEKEKEGGRERTF